MTSHSEKQDLREEADTWKPCPVQCPNYSFPGSCSCDNESPRPRYKLPSKAYREALENDAPIKRTLATPDPRDEMIAELEQLVEAAYADGRWIQASYPDGNKWETSEYHPMDKGLADKRFTLGIIVPGDPVCRIWFRELNEEERAKIRKIETEEEKCESILTMKPSCDAGTKPATQTAPAGQSALTAEQNTIHKKGMSATTKAMKSM